MKPAYLKQSVMILMVSAFTIAGYRYFSSAQVPPDDTLSIQIAGTNVITSWTGSNYILQTGSNLATPTLWPGRHLPVINSGPRHTVTPPITCRHQFFLIF